MWLKMVFIVRIFGRFEEKEQEKRPEDSLSTERLCVVLIR